MSLTKASFSMINGAPVNVLDFGAVGDGSNDDTQAIKDAIAFCQTTLSSLYFPAGIYKITSTITLAGPGNLGIALIGEGFGEGSQQQGSVRPATTLRWAGGASPMFTVAGTFYRFIGMAIENFGTATDFLNCTSAMHMLLQNLSFEVGSGATRFSRSAIHTEGNWLGYSRIVGCQVVSPAPHFISIDGQGTGNGITPFSISNCIFDTFTSAPMTVVYVKDEVIDVLTLNNNTFNGQNNAELTVVETFDTPVSQAILSLQVLYNEFDFVSNNATHRAFRLTNCPNVCFVGNQIQAGGTINSFADLVNSTVTKCEANHVNALNGPLFTADSTSRVYSGVNYLAPGNSDYLVNNTSATSGLIEMPYGTSVIVKGGLGVGTGTTIFRVVVTNTTAFSLDIAKPGDSTNQSFMTRGQVFGVMVKNTSGGAITINPEALFKLAGAAFPAPATGNSRTVFFVWDGTNAIEVSRTTADVPN
jgi:Pectate lyase superfamily protein